MQKRHNLSRFLAWFFAILSFILILALGASMFVISKLKKNNLFSKHIMLDNNYFINNNAYDVKDFSTDTDIKSSIAEIGEGAALDEGMPNENYLNIEAEVSKVVENIKNNYTGKINNDSKELYITYDNLFRELCMIYSTFGITEEGRHEVHEYLEKYFEIDISFSSLFPSAKTCIDVPYISQENDFPNGCEAVSATMLLRFYGFDINADTFVDNYLDCEPISISFGCKYGPNPKYSYAGDPRSESGGLGCFAPVIIKAMNKYLPEGYCAVNTTGQSLNTLKEKYVKNGIPVLIWGTVGMKEVSKILQWQSYDHRETFLYPENEHCMVFVGFDEENYIFNDPYSSNGVISYPIEDCVLAFNFLGTQSVIIEKTS